MRMIPPECGTDHKWQQWLHSAFARVRWRSLDFAEAPARRAFERAGANGCERFPGFAMQKVEGSSPFIRFKNPVNWGFCSSSRVW
jgi:hypothetical protein